MLEPDLIDPRTFAAQGCVLEGCLSLEEMDERVKSHEYLADKTKSLRISLRGGTDKLSRPFLDFSVHGGMPLVCQCCMQPLAFELDECARIVLFDDEVALDAAMAADDGLDGMLCPDVLSVRTLAEDQILMAMPYAPRHENCVIAEYADAGCGKPNPFAVLSGLKSNN